MGSANRIRRVQTDDMERDVMKETGLVGAHSPSRPAWGVGGGLLPTPWPFGVSSGIMRRVVCSLPVLL